eukprot:756065-Hanusia_phi.AAC.2
MSRWSDPGDVLLEGCKICLPCVVKFAMTVRDKKDKQKKLACLLRARDFSLKFRCFGNVVDDDNNGNGDDGDGDGDGDGCDVDDDCVDDDIHKSVDSDHLQTEQESVVCFICSEYNLSSQHEAQGHVRMVEVLPQKEGGESRGGVSGVLFPACDPPPVRLRSSQKELPRSRSRRAYSDVL